MGRIASTYNIMPEGIDVDLNKIITTISNVIPAGIELKETSIEPMAFGLMKIVAFFIIDDSVENIGNQLESKLRSIDGVSEIENTDSTVI
ncbi:MAG: elongation factor 1-beta [archaeon]|nr:elongation factor 1-beta [archaeon]